MTSTRLARRCHNQRADRKWYVHSKRRHSVVRQQNSRRLWSVCRNDFSRICFAFAGRFWEVHTGIQNPSRPMTLLPPQSRAAGSDGCCRSQSLAHTTTQSIAIQYARQGVRVNAILPGFMDTPITRQVAGQYESSEAMRAARGQDATRPPRHCMGRGQCGALPCLRRGGLRQRRMPAGGRGAELRRCVKRGDRRATYAGPRDGAHSCLRRGGREGEQWRRTGARRRGKDPL